MLGHFGFSYVGLVILLMLLIPNLIWAKRPPAGYSQTGENKVLLIFERVGQVLCTCCALIFEDFNLSPFTPWSLWLIASFLLMLFYELSWIRYFKGPRTNADFYKSLWGIPAPLAVLPVAAFFLLGVYGRVVWMVLSSIILGIGHIGIHLGHLRAAGKTGGFEHGCHR